MSIHREVSSPHRITPTEVTNSGSMSADKYHKEWIIHDIKTDAYIVNSQINSFRFLSDMAHVLDNAIKMLEGIKQVTVMARKLDLMKRKCFYLEMANEIGSNFGGTI